MRCRASLASDLVPRTVRDKRRRSPETGSGSTATCSLHRPEPRSIIVPIRGLLIVNDAPPPMAPEWRPDPDEFPLLEAALGRTHRSRMAPNGTHTCRPD